MIPPAAYDLCAITTAATVLVAQGRASVRIWANDRTINLIVRWHRRP